MKTNIIGTSNMGGSAEEVNLPRGRAKVRAKVRANSKSAKTKARAERSNR
jgi:hypothetical protein